MCKILKELEFLIVDEAITGLDSEERIRRVKCIFISENVFDYHTDFARNSGIATRGCGVSKPDWWSATVVWSRIRASKILTERGA